MTHLENMKMIIYIYQKQKIFDEYNGSFDVKIGNVIEKLKEVEKEDLTNE